MRKRLLLISFLTLGQAAVACLIPSNAFAVTLLGIDDAATLDSPVDDPNTAGSQTTIGTALVSSFDIGGGIVYYRGVSEFNLSTINFSNVGNATLNFSEIGSFGSIQNENIGLYGYFGDGTYNENDYNDPTSQFVTSFKPVNVGNSNASSFNFDVTAQLQRAISAGQTYLGFRLQGNPAFTPDEGASFAGFNLSANAATPSQPVPEPMTILGSLAACGVGVGLKKRFKSSH